MCFIAIFRANNLVSARSSIPISANNLLISRQNISRTEREFEKIPARKKMRNV